MGDRIFCQHGNIVGCDHFRQTVVHFRINMVRTSGQNDSPVSCFIQEFNSFLTLPAHILPAGGELCPCVVNSGPDLTFT